MFRNFKGIFFVVVLVILGLFTLLIPQINIGSFERGEADSVLGLKLGLDLQGGTHLVYKFISEDEQPITPEDIEGVKKIVEKRVNEFGVSEPNVQLLGNNPPDRILVQLPGQKGISLTISFNSGVISTNSLKNFLTYLEKESYKKGISKDNFMFATHPNYEDRLNIISNL